MGHPVFRPALSPGQSYCPVHLLLVALQHRDVVSEDEKDGHFQLALGSALKRALRFGEAVGEKIGQRKTAIRNRKVGIGRDSFLGRFNRSFESAGPMSGKAP